MLSWYCGQSLFLLFFSVYTCIYESLRIVTNLTKKMLVDKTRFLRSNTFFSCYYALLLSMCTQPKIKCAEREILKSSTVGWVVVVVLMSIANISLLNSFSRLHHNFIYIEDIVEQLTSEGMAIKAKKFNWLQQCSSYYSSHANIVHTLSVTL